MNLESKIAVARAEAAARFDSMPVVRESFGVAVSIGCQVPDYQAAKDKYLNRIEKWERDQHAQKQSMI